MGNGTLELLLVEDNPGDVRLVREAFDQGRFQNNLHVATDGEEALDFVYGRGEHADAPRPDLVLLDLNLPKTSGQEVLDEMKSDDDLRRIPVIVLTSSRARGDLIDSYDRHTNAYLTKPTDPDEYVDLVRTVESFWLSLVKLPPKGD